MHSLEADYLILEATKIPFITEKANQIQARIHTLHEINGFDWPDYFLLEKVQERLKSCDVTESPSMQNLVDVMLMLCMRSAEVASLCINRYRPSRESWYNPDYCIVLVMRKNKGELGEPRPFLTMEKNPMRVR